MEWNQFVLFIQLVATQYCKEYEPKQTRECIELVQDCVLDGEQLYFCIKHWK